jgi:hypothetical protein
MYGIKSIVVFVVFLFVSVLFLGAVYDSWKDRHKTNKDWLSLIGLTALVLLWVLGISSVYLRKARFLHELSTLNAADVYSIQIGRHDFRDHASIGEVIAALRHSRWFEVNHGGWGNSIPLTVRRHSGTDLKIDVALYFREPAAIVGPATPQGLGYSPTQLFVSDLPQVLERHDVKLPNCDSAHGRPCTPDQLNP